MIQGKADRLVLGNIVTCDDRGVILKAMTIKDGLVQYVGTEEMARKLCDDKTIVMDYGDNYIYPGMMDAHTHGNMAGNRLVFQAPLTMEMSLEEIIATMKQYMADHPGRSKYVGSGWTFDGVHVPDAKMLDEICPDVPMLLNTLDGHSMWVNTATMKANGLDTKETMDLYGPGMIRVREDGTASGFISETPATALVYSILDVEYDEYKEMMLAWQEFAFSKGLTAVCCAALMNEKECRFMRRLCDEGVWKLRTYGVVFMPNSAPDYIACVRKIKELADECNCEYFQITGVKIIIDGVIEAHTGWLLEEYCDQPGYYGEKLFTDKKRVTELIKEANRLGLLVHCHTVGDGAIRFVTDCMEAAQTETGIMDPRNAMCHLQCVNPADFKRMGELNIMAIVPPLWIPTDGGQFYDTECSWVGPERAYADYPIRSFIDNNVVTSFHTDFPISPVVDNAQSIYCAVERNASTFSPRHQRNPYEAITPEQALMCMTRAAAYTFKQEARLGILATGMVANMTVYDRNLITPERCSLDERKHAAEAKLVATCVDGVEVFRGE